AMHRCRSGTWFHPRVCRRSLQRRQGRSSRSRIARCRRHLLPGAGPSPAARFHPHRDPARHHPARTGTGTGVLDPSCRDRDGGARRTDRRAQRAHARGRWIPAASPGLGDADRVRHRRRQRPHGPLHRRTRAHALRRRPAGLPRPRRAASARCRGARWRRRRAAGGLVRDGSRRRHQRGPRRAPARSPAARPGRGALPLPRPWRGRSARRMDRYLGAGRHAAPAGVGGAVQPQRWRLAADGGDAAAAHGRDGAVRRPCRAHVRGAALILVLWLIALLAALIGAFALTARTEYMQGRTLGSGLVAAQAARAGLEYAATRVSVPDPSLQWLPDGRAYRWRFTDAEIEVRIVDESGKLDLNAAEAASLSALMRVVGAEPQQADAVAAAIVDWRDPDDMTQPQGGAEDPQYAAAGLAWGAKDAPFETVAEVEQVLGMTPALFAQLAPHLTIHSGLPVADARFATQAV